MISLYIVICKEVKTLTLVYYLTLRLARRLMKAGGLMRTDENIKIVS